MKLNEGQLSYLENALYDYFSNGEQILISPVEVLSIVNWGSNEPDDAPCQSNVIYKVYCGFDGPKNEDCRRSIEFTASVCDNKLEDLLLGWGGELCWPTNPEYIKSAQRSWFIMDQKRNMTTDEYAQFLRELK